MESRWIWPFELLDKLGEGGMGVVYRARYVGNDRMVAVKLVPQEVAQNPTLLARFERELEVLKQLRHPHIVHCFGGVCESKQRFYAMELVEGGTLHGLLREVGKLPWETVVDYGLQMCSALQCAHEQNVVHRDVKPGNFLLTKTGKLKLSDFGLAIVVASQRITSAGKTLGTFHYMAPEQIRGKPPVSNKTDLYALGCVFFEMLTGSPPFDADNAAEVLHKHLKEEPPRVRSLETGCPPELDELVADLLEKSPEGRPPTAAAVADRLRSITAPPSTSVNSLSLTPSVPRPVIDDGYESSVPPAVSRSGSSSWWLKGMLLIALVWIALLHIQLWRANARVEMAEAASIGVLKHGTTDVKMAAIRAVGQLRSLHPKTEQELVEQLKSPDRNLRLAIVQLMIGRPELAKAGKADLYRLQRLDPDPEVRTQVELALEASKRARSGNSILSAVLSWVIPIGVVGILLILAWNGFIWAKNHALIPGL